MVLVSFSSSMTTRVRRRDGSAAAGDAPPQAGCAQGGAHERPCAGMGSGASPARRVSRRGHRPSRRAGDSPVVEDGDILLDEAEILEPVMMALVHGLPAALALGAFACLLSVAFHRGVVASGVGLGVVLATGIFHEAMGDAAPLWFADTLAGFGPDSFLEQAAGFSQGMLNYYPESFNAVVETGWWAPLYALVISVCAAILVFRRRSL